MRTLARLSLLLGALVSTSVLAIDVGDTLKPIELRNADDQPVGVPDFGKKVIALFYSDADVADVNDALADALKEKNFDKSLYRGMGVANLEDSKAPNFIIRSIVKGKVEKYKATILLDPNLTLPKTWGIGDCNNQGVVLIIGPDMKVKYFKKGAVAGAEVATVTALVETLTKDLKAQLDAAAKPSEPAPAP